MNSGSSLAMRVKIGNSAFMAKKPEIQRSLTISQYRSQMKGFQTGSLGGGFDEAFTHDSYYQSGYNDGQAVRKNYSESLKRLLVPVASHPVNEPLSNNPASPSGEPPASSSPS